MTLKFTSTIQTNTFDDGTSVRYKYIISTKAETPVVVLIGGAFQDIDNLESCAHYLRNDYHVVVIEAPGYGKTASIPLSMPLQQIVDSIIITIYKLGIEDCFLFACSFGGLFSGLLCESKDIQIHKVVLMGFAPLTQMVTRSLQLCQSFIAEQRYDDFNFLFAALLMNNSEHRSIKHFERINKNLFEQMEQFDEKTYEQINRYIFRILHANTAPFIFPKCPVLMMTGEHDIFTPVASMKDFASENTLNNITVKAIKDSDHLCLIEQRKLVAKEIISFFREQ